MRCTLVLFSNAGFYAYSGLQVSRVPGSTVFAIVMDRQQTWQEQTILISRRWSVIVEIANAISKPGVFGQASIAGQWFQTAAVSIKSGGR